WLTLPYLVWCGIFEHVAAALHDPDARREDVAEASDTLLSAARAAKVFTEPALTALYKIVSLSPSSAPRLLQKITLPCDATSFNYRLKVESVRMEVGETLGKKLGGNYLDLKALVQNLPRLQHVDLFFEKDGAPFRELDIPSRWKYSDELFSALEPLPNGDADAGDKTNYTQLRSWTWSSRLAAESCKLEKLHEVHRTPPFSTLRKITFINYQLPSLNSRAKDPAEIMAMDEPVTKKMAAAIKALPRLEHLVLQSSTVANAALLELLPKNLKQLELINCWDVESEHLTAFLITHGHSLERLTLNHCQSLSLGFLPVLGSACPNLTHLNMDLQYFRHHEYYDDSEPNYETLLNKDQVPVWPSTIQCIDIQHLHHWDIDAASMFFQSLEDSALRMPNLRRLALKATLNVPFRQRAEFREYWVERMSYIFQRPNSDPKPVLRAKAPVVSPQRDGRSSVSGGNAKTWKFSTTPARRSTRIADLTLSPVSPHEEDVIVSGREHARTRQLAKEAKHLRLRTTRRGNEADDEDSGDELAATPLSNDSDNEPVHRQLLCNLVDVQIDNQKPTERRYGMEDFLDSPNASDDEWNGRDDPDI
ncbi:uncharacterized protein BCR38DRAFT_308908, partial [Pseudomassariella vexata]